MLPEDTTGGVSTHVDAVLDHIASCASLPLLWRDMIGYFKAEGFHGLTYYLVRPVSSLPAMAPLHHGMPPGAVASYFAQDFARLDVIPRYILARGWPMRWGEVIRQGEMTSEERAFTDRNRAAGLGDGIGLPCYGPRFCNAHVGLTQMAGRVDLSPANLARLHFVAQAAHLRVCSVINAELPDGRRLSEREKEILLWVARGKSNTVIGEILNISSGTVDTYMRRIYEKLDVSDRTSAAVKGVGLGLIAA